MTDQNDSVDADALKVATFLVAGAWIAFAAAAMAGGFAIWLGWDGL